MAYEQEEPFLLQRGDIQAATVASTVVNAAAALIRAWGGRVERLPELEAFLPAYWAEQNRNDVRALSVDEQVAFIELLAKSMGAEDLRK